MIFEYYQPYLDISLKIKKDILHNIYQILEQHSPNEFGGIFLGKVDTKNSAAEITQVLIPEKYEQTETSFKRYSDDLNNKIEDIFKKDTSIKFLGEWHSHPFNSPIPSETDYLAMLKLSEQESISLKTPILLIVSFNKNMSFSPRFYIMYKNKFYPYESL
ncbi:unnamed protein product [Chrysoparadoxa australica]